MSFSLIYLCPLLFLAGFVDAIAGGGGLISMPAYLMTGMPIHTAYGCNKLQSACGTGFALREFMKNKLLDYKTAAVSAILALTGSAIATKIVFYLPENLLKKMLLVIFPVVAVLVVLKTGMTSRENTEERVWGRREQIQSAFLGLVIGLYDGLFGPGGAMIAIFLYVIVMKYDMRTASGNAKFVIFVSNLAALLFYMKSGNIYYAAAIPATLFNMAGNYAGSKFAIHNGKRIIRPAMSIVAALLLIKTAVGFLPI